MLESCWPICVRFIHLLCVYFVSNLAEESESSLRMLTLSFSIRFRVRKEVKNDSNEGLISNIEMTK